MESLNPHRLPRTVSPEHYELRFRPDIDDASFRGESTVSIVIHEPVSQIVLNAVELDIESVVLNTGGDDRVPTVTFIEDLERLVLDFDAPLAPGEATLSSSFTGILNDKLRGFYRSTFTDDDGTEHTIATTQFESTNARRCFPCWDEPDRKAVFEVSLEVPPGMLAVSAQAEVERLELDTGDALVRFGPTPVMSTYLLAFVVGDLEASPAIDVDGVPVRIVHRPGRGGEIAFAHDAAVFCLRWLTDYFGVPYFGDKIDLLAIPDFAFGAMENTGCVTFREVLLLVDPAATTQPEQQRSVAVIAHELAHMWFGNLVTMKWWEGLWLKEAFATFMETAATDAYRPDWKVWDSFALERSSAYEVDGLRSTRPIEYEVASPAEAEGMYDVLTYEKGAAVVRMLEQFVGPDRFREGIRHYMRTHAFGNTVTSDLWDAIGTATDEPVADIMHEWINVGGFPLIEASINGGTVDLTQHKFELMPTNDANGGTGPSWKIPVTVAVGAEKAAVLMDPDASVPVTDQASLVVVDPDTHGFFRVRYDGVLGDRLAEQLMQLSPGQRYSVLDDAFDLVLAGRSAIGEFIALARSLRNETSPPVWASAAGGFTTLAHVAPDRKKRAHVGRLWSEFATPELDSLGFDRKPGETDQLINEVRASLYGTIGSLALDDTVIEHARGVFGGTIDIDNASVESAAIRVIASTGDRADYDDMFSRFTTAASPQLERRYLFALPRFDDAGAIADLCDRTLDGSIRSQDAAFVLGIGLANRWHGETVWNFITTNWERINATVPDNVVDRMLGGVQWLEHGDIASDVHEFLAAHPVPQAKLAIAQHLERLDVHVALRRRFEAEIPDA